VLDCHVRSDFLRTSLWCCDSRREPKIDSEGRRVIVGAEEADELTEAEKKNARRTRRRAERRTAAAEAEAVTEETGESNKGVKPKTQNPKL
jgi:hypothetical protein